MNNVNYVLEWGTGSDLEQMIEPLASYICATERPKTALHSALAVLFREVEQTNRAAIGHFRTLLEN